ncbi:hypothetical protein [Tunicatimonas pelagia]|nr:hypothetical protein [Tunicatimonas pelagia]WKN43865.1 hypothetical protein P0M28_02625 [Tunicatimonas pelagia]
MSLYYTNRKGHRHYLRAATIKKGALVTTRRLILVIIQRRQALYPAYYAG